MANQDSRSFEGVLVGLQDAFSDIHVKFWYWRDTIDAGTIMVCSSDGAKNIRHTVLGLLKDTYKPRGEDTFEEEVDDINKGNREFTVRALVNGVVVGLTGSNLTNLSAWSNAMICAEVGKPTSLSKDNGTIDEDVNDTLFEMDPF